MSGKPTPESEMVREYCRIYSNMPTLTLARRLHEDMGLFDSTERARDFVRYYRGERGDKQRNKVDNAGTFTPTTKYECQASHAPTFQPVDLDVTGYGCIMADLHMPYHDKEAIEAAVEHAQKRNATRFLLILGDLLDCYQESAYCRDPRRASLDAELATVYEFLSDMTRMFDTVIFKGGNHERRHQDYIYRHAPALAGIRSLELPQLMGLPELGIEYVSWDSPIYAGEHLTLIHGHEYGRSLFSPVNAARGLFMRALECSITAHYHRTSHHDEADIRGRDISTWSVGCLCDLHPEYARLNKWNHGFMLFETDGADDWNVENHRIVQGRVR